MLRFELVGFAERWYVGLAGEGQGGRDAGETGGSVVLVFPAWISWVDGGVRIPIYRVLLGFRR